MLVGHVLPIFAAVDPPSRHSNKENCLTITGAEPGEVVVVVFHECGVVGGRG